MEKYIKNKYVMGSVALLVVCIVLAIVTGGGGNSPEGILKRLEKGINSKNEEKILSCYDSNLTMLYKTAKSMNPSFSLSQEMGYDEEKIKFLINNVEIQDQDQATISVMEITTDKKTGEEMVQSDSYRMENQKGKWVIKY